MTNNAGTLKPYVYGEIRLLSLLKEAVGKTFSLQYLKAAVGWFALVSILHMCALLIDGNPDWYQTILFVFEVSAMSAIAVAWYRNLAFDEKIPLLRFKKRELIYAVLSFAFIVINGYFIGNIFFAPTGVIQELIVSLYIVMISYAECWISLWLALKVIDLPTSFARHIIAPFKVKLLIVFCFFLYLPSIINSMLGAPQYKILGQFFSFIIYGIDVSFIFLLIKARVDFESPARIDD